MSRNDLREMGRVTSIFLKGMDSLNENIIFIATTNMFGYLDKALIRRFDATISFDRYSKNDLIEIADSMLTAIIKKSPGLKLDIRFFNKILKNLSEVPFPGDLKQIIKTSVAFSDHSLEYDYLRKLYFALNNNPLVIDAHSLNDDGYTAREIKILTRYDNQ